MPARNQIETIRIPGWEGGLNADADPFQLEPNEVPDCMNVYFGLRGAATKRKGYTKYSDAGLTDKLRRLFTWTQSGGTSYLVGVERGASTSDFRYSSGATFSSQVSGWGAPTSDREWHVGMASYQDVLYITSLLGDAWKWDGTTWTQITDKTLDGSGTEFPRAMDLETAHERVFAVNVSDGTTNYRNRVWFSSIDVGVADPEKWNADDWIDVDPDDGQQLWAIKLFGESLILFKDHSTYLLAGTDPNTFTLYPLDQGIGTTAPRTVVSRESKVIFFDPSTGVWEFDGAGFTPLSDKVLEHILENINPLAASKSSAFIWRSRYFLSVPWGGSDFPNRTFVYDLRTEAWTQYDYGAMDWAFIADDVYTVSTRDAAGVFRMFDGYNDAGASYPAFFETSWMHPENESVKQRVRRADFSFSALQDVNLTVQMYRNFEVDPIFTKTVNTAPGGSLWGAMVWGVDTWGLGVDQVFVQETGWPKRFRVVKFRVSQNDLDSRFQVNRMLLHVSSMDRVRGEV